MELKINSKTTNRIVKLIFKNFGSKSVLDKISRTIMLRLIYG